MDTGSPRPALHARQAALTLAYVHKRRPMNICPKCNKDMDLATRQSLRDALRRIYICEHCGSKIRYHWFPDAVSGLSVLTILIPIYFESRLGFNAFVASLFVLSFFLVPLQMWLGGKLPNKMTKAKHAQ